MLKNNKTIEFFAKNPKYVNIISAVLSSDEKVLRVIKCRLEGELLRTIGEDLGCTREAVRQIEAKGLLKIQKFILRIY